MDKTPLNNPRKNPRSGSNIIVTILTVFIFLMVFTALGVVAFLFVKHASLSASTFSSVSDDKSKLEDEFAVLSSSLQANTSPSSNIIIGTPSSTDDSSSTTETAPTSTNPSIEIITTQPTTPPTTETPSSSTETPTTPEPTTPEPTTPEPTTEAPTTSTQPPTPPVIQQTPPIEQPTTPAEPFVQQYVTMNEGKYEYRIPLLSYMPMHNYKWEFLKTLNNGLRYYAENGTKNSLIGIDVSSHQKEIDWKKVKAAGVEFAIIRVGLRGYGTGALVVDEYFHTNIKAALNAGIKVGVYIFSQAITPEEAIEEAELVLKEIKGYKITFPVVYDPEDISGDTARTDDLNGEQLTEHCIAFCETVKEAGYTPMIYVNKRWALTRLDMTRLTDYDIWLATYVEEPNYPYQFTMWQYSSSGKVNGISGNVDLNISFVDYSKK